MTSRPKLTTGQAARYLGISVTHVHYLIKNRKLTGEKTPLGFLVDPESADAWKRERDARLASRGHPTTDSADDGSQLVASA